MSYSAAGEPPYARRDFTALAAASMPSARRATLMAIERASAQPPPGGDRLRIAAAMRPDAKLRGANEIRFAAPPVSATN